MADWVLVLQALSLLKTLLWESLKVLVCAPFSAVVCLLKLKPRRSGSCEFYEGTVWHCRRAPKVNKFKYDVRMVVVDLDDPPSWWTSQSKHHLSPQEARELAGTNGVVKLLSTPVSCGYVQNPISVYYCHSEAGSLQKCIAEVTNTPWGERVSFLFDPEGQTVPKSLHVSPFMDMQSVWTLKATPPSATLKLSVLVTHPVHGQFFDAVLSLQRCGSHALRSEQSGLMTFWRYGFMPQRVSFWIYWQAVKLLWKGVPFFSPPPKKYREDVNQKARNDSLPSGEKFLWREATEYPFTVA